MAQHEDDRTIRVVKAGLPSREKRMMSAHDFHCMMSHLGADPDCVICKEAKGTMRYNVIRRTVDPHRETRVAFMFVLLKHLARGTGICMMSTLLRITSHRLSVVFDDRKAEQVATLKHVHGGLPQLLAKSRLLVWLAICGTWWTSEEFSCTTLTHDTLVREGKTIHVS